MRTNKSCITKEFFFTWFKNISIVWIMCLRSPSNSRIINSLLLNSPNCNKSLKWRHPFNYSDLFSSTRPRNRGYPNRKLQQEEAMRHIAEPQSPFTSPSADAKICCYSSIRVSLRHETPFLVLPDWGISPLMRIFGILGVLGYSR